ncbi:hypothetical protein KAK06_22040 [Ideonella sp. 4Y11]|uniref:Uncharacterized protein n=1 Tax=Ideonella aquatica TaxID=2824119 RepID=A0A940YN39_9BURK|nr:hypothetical protein [Ideonella aquatica]MBQ0961637.1 hypothetical protein [Ideonella aquatica]
MPADEAAADFRGRENVPWLAEAGFKVRRVPDFRARENQPTCAPARGCAYGLR